MPRRQDHKGDLLSLGPHRMLGIGVWGCFLGEIIGEKVGWWRPRETSCAPSFVMIRHTLQYKSSCAPLMWGGNICRLYFVDRQLYDETKHSSLFSHFGPQFSVRFLWINWLDIQTNSRNVLQVFLQSFLRSITHLIQYKHCFTEKNAKKNHKHVPLWQKFYTMSKNSICFLISPRSPPPHFKHHNPWKTSLVVVKY